MRALLEAVLATALLLGIFQSGCSVTFEVKDDANKTCILTDFSINFTVEYKKGDKQAIASFPLPESAAVDKLSSCGKTGTEPILVITFGSNFSLSVHFNKTDTDYRVEQLVFVYNLSDANTFPEAAEKGTKQVSSNKPEISAKKNNYYQCSSPHLVRMDNVNATFHNVKLEAYFSGSNYSGNATLCKEDATPTSAPTVAPHTSTHTPTPTSAPVKPKTPDNGEYRVNASSGTLCIFAKMGLQLNITYRKNNKNVSYEFNIDPNQVKPDGNCSNDYATLRLFSKVVDLLFNFTLNTTENKFYLGHVNLSTIVPDGNETINVDSGSLSYLQTTTHKSYKCNAKQTLKITDDFSINTYNLQIQAFDIDGNKFGPAVECAEDQNGMLVPIIVGAALAGLVLIVLIAYLIGRKRSHAGYQTI
ncbi:lysosome-associated membrane glycoprotein 1 [Hyla sarda]|uniref:lysosome-associated membrane glycoprotein 1 n=1 Tax=Hyla sarda TaxID=327740 RepID=UPI0024C3F8AF|nr:lysosome-associated membrane glycoprotein 1 [Hyla sarda]